MGIDSRVKGKRQKVNDLKKNLKNCAKNQKKIAKKIVKKNKYFCALA